MMETMFTWRMMKNRHRILARLVHFNEITQTAGNVYTLLNLIPMPISPVPLIHAVLIMMNMSMRVVTCRQKMADWQLPDIQAEAFQLLREFFKQFTRVELMILLYLIFAPLHVEIQYLPYFQLQ